MKFLMMAATAALALVAGSAQAASPPALTLDQDTFVTLSGAQQYQTSTTGARSGSGGSDLIQTFTAGLSGQLDTLSLQARSGGPATTFTLSLYDGDGYTTPSSLVGTKTFSTATANVPAGAGFSIDVTSLNLILQAGRTYSFGLQAAQSALSASPSTLQIVVGTNEGYDDDGDFINSLLTAYAGGQAYSIWHDPAQAASTSANLGADRSFRTYVDTSVSPAPEPGEWALMAGGLGIVGAVARRRRKA